MISSIVQSVAAGDAPPFAALTVEQYHEMIRAGVLPEGAPIELLDGMLVYKDRRDDPDAPLMNQGPRHSMLVTVIYQLLDPLVEPLDCHVRGQLPITLPPGNEPEPDIAIVAGHPRDYATAQPTADQTFVCVEVADSSRRLDRGTKRAIYAAAGIPTYLIVDLRNEVVEFHTAPNRVESDYDRREEFGRGENVTIDVAGNSITFAVDDLLP